MTLTPHTLRLAVGSIALALGAAMVALMLSAANGAFADDYRITAQTARTGFGLDDASEVKIRGITVGSVEGVELLDDGSVQLTLNIAKEIRIPVDATATIEPLSVFGPKFVDIRPGASETTGPFLGAGESLASLVEPTELAETLDAVATLLDTVDTDDVTTIITELARGLDGLGDELGATVDSANDVAARLDAKMPVIEQLLIDARLLSATLSARSDDLVALGVDGQELLRSLDERGDELGVLLHSARELSQRADGLLGAVAGDLGPTLDGLERGTDVLETQLEFLPDFVDGLDAVSALLGKGLLQWDRGGGVYGGIGHGILDFEPCGLVADDRCPPRAGYDG